MDIKQMRLAMEKKYSKSFVARMKDDQVIAFYKRLKLNNKI